MPFDQSNFAPIGANSSTSPRFWSYKTDDEVDVVLGENYFLKKKFQLSPGDFIYVDSSFGGFSRVALIRYDGDGVASHDFAPSNHTISLIADDLTNQNPSGLDTPMQVKFGPAQGPGQTRFSGSGYLCCTIGADY